MRNPEADWIDGQRFVKSIEPFIKSGTRYNRYSSFIINGIKLKSYDKNREVIRKLIQKKRSKIKGATAERILATVGLDPHIEDEMIRPIKGQMYKDYDNRVLVVTNVKIGDSLGREVQGKVDNKDYSCTLAMWGEIWRDRVPTTTPDEMSL